MDNPEKVMMQNIEKKFGKPFSDWLEVVNNQYLGIHSDIINFLKDNHGFTH